jgi:uncharacterized protein YbcI
VFLLGQKPDFSIRRSSDSPDYTNETWQGKQTLPALMEILAALIATRRHHMHTPSCGGMRSEKRCMRSRGEIEAAVCGAVARFQQDYLGRGPRDIQTRLIDATLIVHLRGVLSVAEQRLLHGPTAADGRGAALVKQLRSHLVLSGRPVLEGLVADATGSRPVSVHHDISTVTGEEVIVVTLAAAPECRTPRKR